MSNVYDFEGYKIYRSTDPDFRDVKVLTTGRGNPSTLNGKPIEQFDLADGIVRYRITSYNVCYTKLLRVFKGDKLFLAFDVNDQVVQAHPNFDSWDGFIVGLNETGRDSIDHVLQTRRITFTVGPDGEALPQDYLPFLIDSLNGAQVRNNFV